MRSVWIVLISALFVLLGMSVYQKQNESVSLVNVQMHPLDNIENRIDISNLGKEYVLHFFASWCHYCQREHGEIIKFHKKHPNVKIYGVVYMDDPERVRMWLKENGDPFNKVFFDGNGELGDMVFHLKGIPSTYSIAHGKVKGRVSGFF